MKVKQSFLLFFLQHSRGNNNRVQHLHWLQVLRNVSLQSFLMLNETRLDKRYVDTMVRLKNIERKSSFKQQNSLCTEKLFCHPANALIYIKRQSTQASVIMNTCNPKNNKLSLATNKPFAKSIILYVNLSHT